MKRDTLKWILVAAVVVAAAAYLYFSERKPNERQGRRKARTEQVAIAEGHSKAFKIEPMEGITISASENALDKDREFKISPVSDKVWDKATEKVKQAAPWETPLLCFDLDAGMKPDQQMPGYFQVSLDLNKLGIPRSLHDKLTVWRNNGDQTYQYTSWVENGKLYFNSDQNCSIILAFAVGVPFLCSVMWTTSTIGKHKDVLRMYKYFFFKEDDLVMQEVKDKYGNFELYFRYKDTEWADRFDSYKNHSYLYKKELEKLEAETEEIYSKRVDKQYRGELADMNRLQQLYNSRAAYNRAKEAVDRAFILDSLSTKDEDLQRHIKAMELPPSIRDIEQFLKLAGPYLTENQHMKPQTRTVEVYLVDTKNAKGSNAVIIHRVMKDNPYMLVDYEKLWTGNPGKTVYNRRGKGEGMLLSITHELFHHRHKITKDMDFRTEETLAAYNEFAAGYYYYLNGEITENIFSINPEEGKPYYEESFELSPRMNHEVFGLDFNTSTSDPGIAYTYADFMDFLQWKTKGRYKFVEGGTLVALYNYYNSHVKNYKDWFFIDDDKKFAEYFHGFSHWKADKIWFQQSNNSNTSKENRQVDIEMKPHSPVARIKTSKGEYVARSAYITSGMGKKAPDFNLFFVRDKDVAKEDLSFIASYDDFAVNRETGEYINTQPGDYCGDGHQRIYKVVYSKIPNQSLSFLAVALFAPDMPEIRKVKEDQISFIVPKPDRDLRKDKLITGALVTYKDKNGVEHTHKVAPKYFGKKVKWTVEGASKPGNAFSLSVHWFYQPDEGTTYDSPESEKATWGVMEDDKPEEVSDYRPETNYWKRVSIRGNMVTSGKVEEKLDGVDFVNPDYRFVELKQDMGIFEIEGWAAVNTSKDERIYERTLSLDGDLTMTTPPEFWVPGAEYAGVWSIEQDPYVAKIGDPFGFKAEITTTSDKACAASRKAKTDTGRSQKGGSPWIRKYTGTFMARHPEGDAPRAFSLTQTFEVAERPGSDRKALVTYIYDYEWVGEPEKEVEEESPQGAGWRLVKTEVDDSKKTQVIKDDSKCYINGSDGNYLVHIEWWDWMAGNRRFLSGIYERNLSIDQPKSFYKEGEVIRLNTRYGSTTILKQHGAYPVFYHPYFKGELEKYDNNNYHQFDVGKGSNGPGYTGEEGVDYLEYTAPKHDIPGFKITVKVITDNVSLSTTYYYEWVEGKDRQPDDDADFGVRQTFDRVIE